MLEMGERDVGGVVLESRLKGWNIPYTVQLSGPVRCVSLELPYLTLPRRGVRSGREKGGMGRREDERVRCGAG